MPTGNDTVIIGIGEYQVGSMPMASIGLGSCVGLVIHDRKMAYRVSCSYHAPILTG